MIRFQVVALQEFIKVSPVALRQLGCPRDITFSQAQDLDQVIALKMKPRVVKGRQHARFTGNGIAHQRFRDQFGMGQRHNLAPLVIMSTDGRINENGGRYVRR